MTSHMVSEAALNKARETALEHIIGAGDVQFIPHVLGVFKGSGPAGGGGKRKKNLKGKKAKAEAPKVSAVLKRKDGQDQLLWDDAMDEDYVAHVTPVRLFVEDEDGDAELAFAWDKGIRPIETAKIVARLPTRALTDELGQLFISLEAMGAISDLVESHKQRRGIYDDWVRQGKRLEEVKEEEEAAAQRPTAESIEAKSTGNKSKSKSKSKRGTTMGTTSETMSETVRGTKRKH